MIKLVYGPKGFGKTKIILDDVNAAAKVAKGNVVFITDKKICSVAIDLNVRCVYTEEYGVASLVGFDGFIKGLLAGNSDIEYLFIDGIARITDTNIAEMEKFFETLDEYAKNGLKIELTISAAKEDLPSFMLKYLG